MRITQALLSPHSSQQPGPPAKGFPAQPKTHDSFERSSGQSTAWNNALHHIHPESPLALLRAPSPPISPASRATSPLKPLVRVTQAGQKPEKFLEIQSIEDVPAHYSSVKGFTALAIDPAKKGKVTPLGLREAMSGLETGFLTHLKLPLTRGPVNIEFFDAKGHPYDVKTPRSPLPHEKWTFNPQKVAKSILKKMRGQEFNPLTDKCEPVRIILDCTYLTQSDHNKLWLVLGPQLSSQEARLLVEINVRFSDE